MNAKEKAEELFTTYRFALSIPNAPFVEQKDLIAKQCALIAVDEIINHHSTEQGLYRVDTYYWQEVKKEIELL
jgi:hypothetical protein